MKPQLLIRYFYAGGDRDPNDDRNGRFNVLFGPTTSELTCRYLRGVQPLEYQFPRLEADPLQPTDLIRVSFQHRVFWLAQSRDQWINTGLQDPTGRVGNLLEHFLEARGR